MEGFRNLLSGKGRLLLMSIALLWIMAFHYSMYGNLLRYDLFQILFGKGYLGVDVFFFLSAYGLCFSYQKNNLQYFYKRRIKKLYPVYLIFLLILLFVFHANGQVAWWKVALEQMTGLATFVGLDVEWYVPALTLLYLFFPLLYKLVEKLYRMGIVTSSVFLVILICMTPILNKFIFYLFPPRFAVIIVGMMTFFALQNDDKKYLLSIYALCALLGLLAIGEDKINVSLTGSLILPLLLYALGQVVSPFYENKLFGIVGKHTLEIYLAQNLAFNQYMASANGSFIGLSIKAAMIILVCSLILCAPNLISNAVRRNGRK